ncbi:MAG TPA: zinc ribbon domain-containing protein [Chloroflexota bacterium]|nr:zinc ribbon domain-containing protein [Chloroflexota bacterium]
MPIYEYRCVDCGAYRSVLVRTFSDPSDLQCLRCNGTQMRKLVSRFAVLHSDDDRLDRLADPSALGDVDENDPRSVARWARRMGSEIGEDLGDDFREAVEQMESGEMPDDVAGEGELGAGADDSLANALE